MISEIPITQVGWQNWSFESSNAQVLPCTVALHIGSWNRMFRKQQSYSWSLDSTYIQHLQLKNTKGYFYWRTAVHTVQQSQRTVFVMYTGTVGTVMRGSSLQFASLQSRCSKRLSYKEFIITQVSIITWVHHILYERSSFLYKEKEASNFQEGREPIDQWKIN